MIGPLRSKVVGECTRNRSFAWLGHMVENPLCWMANGAVGHRKTTELTCEWLSSLYFLCPAAPFAIQLGEFCTMWPSHAKDLLLERGSDIKVVSHQNPPTRPPAQAINNEWSLTWPCARARCVQLRIHPYIHQFFVFNIHLSLIGPLIVVLLLPSLSHRSRLVHNIIIQVVLCTPQFLHRW